MPWHIGSATPEFTRKFNYRITSKNFVTSVNGLHKDDFPFFLWQYFTNSLINQTFITLFARYCYKKKFNVMFIKLK